VKEILHDSLFVYTASEKYSIPITYDTSLLNDVPERNVPQTNSILLNNFPNPFNPSTVISYSILKSAFVTLEIYDMLGREIHTLVNEFQMVGNYSFNFDASKLSSGVYFYRLQLGNDFIKTKKMLLMR
jgi:hypothetical protein